MMMGIDDWQIGFEDLLAALVQPVRPNRRMTARRYCRLRHWIVLPSLLGRFPNSALPSTQALRFFAKRNSAPPKRNASHLLSRVMPAITGPNGEADPEWI